jgi:phage FluMu protein Com
MPIRFRCPQCDRLLGIARRKAGTQTECPQCGKMVTVPVQDDRTELADLDELLNPAAAANGSARPRADATRPLPPLPVPPAEVLDLPPPPKPFFTAPKPAALNDRPLFEKGDVDAMLGLTRPAPDRPALDDGPRAKPVSGMDALSLDGDPPKLVLSPGKATLLAVAVVVLLAVAFAAGYMLAPK